MNDWALGPWELGVDRVFAELEPTTFRTERGQLLGDDGRPVDVARQNRSVEDVEVVVRDAEHVPQELGRHRERAERGRASRRVDIQRRRIGAVSSPIVVLYAHARTHDLQSPHVAVRAHERLDAAVRARRQTEADRLVVGAPFIDATRAVALIGQRCCEIVVRLLDPRREDVSAPNGASQRGPDAFTATDRRQRRVANPCAGHSRRR